MPKKILYLQLALIIILGFSVYANSLDGKFVWDDNGLIKDNPCIKSYSGAAQILTHDMGVGSPVRSNFYRPLPLLTYMLDYSLWGLDVRGYHLVNIALHITAALAVYWFFSIIFNYGTVAFFASLFFAVHPIHTESVAYISGRADCLALLFILLTIIFYIKSISGNSAGCYLLSLLSCFLALLSKENSIILPLVLLLYHYIFRKRIKPGYFLGVLVLVLGYLFLRLTRFNYIPDDAVTLRAILERVPGFFVALGAYLRLLFLPLSLHTEYGNKLFSFADPRAISGILACLALLSIAFYRRKNNKLLSFSILWFFIALLPVTNIYKINESFMMEHWLYLPSLGFFLVLAAALQHPSKNRALVLSLRVLTIGLVIFWSCLTVRQNLSWREPVIFYERNLKFYPDSWRFYNGLGNEYAVSGKSQEAINAYAKALEIRPGLAGVYLNLGWVYQGRGELKEAALMYAKAQEINSGVALGYYRQGNSYLDSGRIKDAARYYEMALELDPGNVDICNALASAYVILGRNNAATVLLEKALELAPKYPLTHNNLAVAYYYGRKYDLALKHYDIAVSLGYPVTPELLKLLKPHRK